MRVGAILALALPLAAVAAEPAEAPTQWKRRSDAGGIEITVAPRSGPPRIGAFQHWVVSLHDLQGNPVLSARIAIDGGMPAHGHGLPTRPQVTQYLGDGRYLVEGVRFNMAGEWVWQLRIETPQGRDTVRFELLIDH